MRCSCVGYGQMQAAVCDAVLVAEPVEPSVPDEGTAVSSSRLSLLGDVWIVEYVPELRFLVIQR